MTYQFPESLHTLRNWLRSQGLHGDSIKTSRQAAFMAQQLLGSRVKFPPQGSDMLPTLLLIQKQLPDRTPVTLRPDQPKDLFGAQPAPQRDKVNKGKKSLQKPETLIYLRASDPAEFESGFMQDGNHRRPPGDGVGMPIPDSAGHDLVGLPIRRQGRSRMDGRMEAERVEKGQRQGRATKPNSTERIALEGS